MIHQNIINENNLPYHLIIFDEHIDLDAHIYPKHYHHHLEIVVSTDGKGEAWINGKQYFFEAPCVLIIDPLVIHSIHGFPPYQENRGYCLQIDLDPFYPFFPELKKGFHPKGNRECIALLQKEVPKLVDHKDPYQCMKILINILHCLSDHCLNKEAIKQNDHILKAIEYIEEHYLEEINNQEIADYIGLSVNHLNHLFSTTLNQSLHNYLMDIRMEHAVSDLKLTDLTILEIALKNGFSTQKSLIRECKKRTGMTPSKLKSLDK